MVSKGVAIMTVDNPPVNALSTLVLNDIKSAVTEALSDDDVRVIIMTGAGKKAFIAGADINEFININTQQAGSEYLINGHEIANMIENADKPFIAAVHGFCLGGGLEFAMVCHIRLADETAQLGLPEIKLGIIPGYGGTQRIPRQIGKSRAMELILSGNFIGAQQAYEWGLLNRITPAGKVLDEALELANVIAAKSRMNISAAIKAINEGMQMELMDSLKLERELFGGLCETDDKVEGVAAFLEKRDPLFSDK